MYLCVCNLSRLLLQGMPHIKSYILNDIKALNVIFGAKVPELSALTPRESKLE